MSEIGMGSPRASGADTAASSVVPAFVRVLRPKQWVKNVLVAAVPLAAGMLLELSVAIATLKAFVAFCLASSAVYVLNDVRDVEADRNHPRKSSRPIAAGQISVLAASALGIACLVASFALAAWTSTHLLWTLVAYVAFNIAYSLGLKHEPVLELGLLTMGFLLRSVAGGAATGLPISRWFLIVAGFGSLMMAAGKRYSELTSVGAGGSSRKSLERYSDTYLRFVWGVAAGIAITGYCLWAFEVGEKPSTVPWALWSVVPFVLAVLSYARRIDAGGAEAPEDVAFEDKQLLGIALVWLVLFGLGAFGV